MDFVNTISQMIDPDKIGVIELTVALAGLFGMCLLGLIQVKQDLEKAQSQGLKWILRLTAFVMLIFMLLSCTSIAYMAPDIKDALTQPTPSPTPPQPTSTPFPSPTPLTSFPNCYSNPNVFPCFAIASSGESVCKIVAKVHDSTVEETKNLCLATCNMPENQQLLEPRFNGLPKEGRNLWEEPCNLIHPGEQIIIPE